MQSSSEDLKALKFLRGITSHAVKITGTFKHFPIIMDATHIPSGLRIRDCTAHTDIVTPDDLFKAFRLNYLRHNLIQTKPKGIIHELAHEGIRFKLPTCYAVEDRQASVLVEFDDDKLRLLLEYRSRTSCGAALHASGSVPDRFPDSWASSAIAYIDAVASHERKKADQVKLTKNGLMYAATAEGLCPTINSYSAITFLSGKSSVRIIAVEDRAIEEMGVNNSLPAPRTRKFNIYPNVCMIDPCPPPVRNFLTRVEQDLPSVIAEGFAFRRRPLTKLDTPTTPVDIGVDIV